MSNNGLHRLKKKKSIIKKALKYLTDYSHFKF